jgi:archaellum component FlaC
MDIEQKLNNITERLSEIERKIDLITSQTSNMETHIHFVNSVYSSLRSPLNFLASYVNPASTSLPDLDESERKETKHILNGSCDAHRILCEAPNGTMDDA